MLMIRMCTMCLYIIMTIVHVYMYMYMYVPEYEYIAMFVQYNSIIHECIYNYGVL